MSHSHPPQNNPVAAALNMLAAPFFAFVGYLFGTAVEVLTNMPGWVAGFLIGLLTLGFQVYKWAVERRDARGLLREKNEEQARRIAYLEQFEPGRSKFTRSRDR